MRFVVGAVVATLVVAACNSDGQLLGPRPVELAPVAGNGGTGQGGDGLASGAGGVGGVSPPPPVVCEVVPCSCPPETSCACPPEFPGAECEIFCEGSGCDFECSSYPCIFHCQEGCLITCAVSCQVDCYGGCIVACEPGAICDVHSNGYPSQLYCDADAYCNCSPPELCSCIGPGCPPPFETSCSDYVDNENDLFTDCEDNDCWGTMDCTPGVLPYGSPCTIHSECATTSFDPLCLGMGFGYPNGYCSEFCDPVANDCGPGGVCVPYHFFPTGAGQCFKTCTSQLDCDPLGLACVDYGFGLHCNL